MNWQGYSMLPIPGSGGAPGDAQVPRTPPGSQAIPDGVSVAWNGRRSCTCTRRVTSSTPVTATACRRRLWLGCVADTLAPCCCSLHRGAADPVHAGGLPRRGRRARRAAGPAAVGRGDGGGARALPQLRRARLHPRPGPGDRPLVAVNVPRHSFLTSFLEERLLC